MERALQSLDLVTLKAWRNDALTQLHALATGSREVSVRHGDVAVQYTEASTAQLTQYISRLDAAISSKESGAPVRGPIYLVF